MNAASVRIDRLGHHYGDRVALDDISLSALGGVITVLGPNGAGKSTLLRSLATVQKPSTGSIHVDGLDISLEPDRTEARRRIGYLPQDPEFAPRARVFDIVDYLAILISPALIMLLVGSIVYFILEVGYECRFGKVEQ